ncbi:hypothetical protein M9Y10_027936 [Tritrichomonas musculus]|uniref:ATPase dynein-related AAA domain-containing protein n=1 Tax=Tritrichomonas musculus TaxID=1915356 RepID=A0ABR2H4J7_9EUKA
MSLILPSIGEFNLLQIKKLADEGDINMMYLYGRKKFNGEDNCERDIEEAKKYINMAAEKDHQNAKLLSLIINDNLLIKNVAFIIKKVKENYDQITKKVHNFANEGLCSKSFIFTQKAIERLTTLYYYLKSGVPVLLEGPTGTSKTLSSEIICKLTRKQFLKFDFCSETKASDLLGRYNADVDSWAGLSMAIGPFRYAYENGCILLLNNINLASNECLKFIGDALDSKKISVEMPGMPLMEIPMHSDFRLIATQNPNKGLFAAKRQDLDPAFLSRFQIIDFPSFGKDELVEIAKGLTKSFHYNASDQFIQDLVDFHMTWSSRDDVKEDVQCFTIREIAAAVHALANGNNCYDTIMTVYGARYKKRQKENLKNFSFLLKVSKI